MSHMKSALSKIKSTAVWSILRKIKHFLFYRRRLIPKGLSTVEFLRQLSQQNCSFVVLRWFDKLPDQWYGEDIDILISDEDSKKLKSFLTRSQNKGGIPCDAYNVNGKHGLHYMGIPYFPPNKAAEILENRVEIASKIPIPSPVDYFYSLAYHAVYHKGVKSGLPVSSNEPSACINPVHDFTTILSDLSYGLNLDIDINMSSLKQALAEKGWSPSEKMLRKYQK